MNKKYWIIISKDNFTNLYKFRDIEVDFADIIHNDIEESIENKFKSLPFDDEFGFIIIKFKDESYNQNSSKYKLDIRNCKSIYTLSEVSQKWYSVKFNQNIKFNVIEYPNILENVKNYKYLENINMGIDILFEQFNIKNKKTLDEKFDEKFKEKLLEYKSSDKHFFKSTNFEKFYFDLLLYERKNDKFGKEDISYVYDVVVLILLQDRKQDTVEKFYTKELKITDKYPFCKILHKEKKPDSLLNTISLMKERENEPDFKTFLKKIDIKDLVISSLFLKIKDLLNEEDGGQKDGYQEEIKSLVSNFQKHYKEEVSIALYLIGLVFGYEKLYDYNYDFIELDLFKDEVEEIDYKKKFEELQSSKKKLQNDLTLQSKELETMSEQNNTLQASKDKEVKTLTDEKIQLEDRKKVLEDSLNSKDIELEKLRSDKSKLEEIKQKLEKEKEEVQASRDNEIKTLMDEKTQLEGELKTTQNEKTELQNSKDKEVEINAIIDTEIVIFSYSHLVKIAKDRGVAQVTAKYYPNNDDGKIKLYKAILNHKIEKEIDEKFLIEI